MTITSIPLFRPAWENFAKLIELTTASTKIHCLMVSSLVMSKLFYCSFVWSNTSSKKVKKLQAVQNFACRIVSNTRKFDHITPAMEEIEWLPIKDLLLYCDTIMTYKCLHGMAPHYLNSKFCNRASIHGRKTRNCDQLQIPLYTTAAGQRLFKFRGVKIWNSLDTDLKEHKSLKNLNLHSSLDLLVICINK